jgi:hypothetical protein
MVTGWGFRSLLMGVVAMVLMAALTGCGGGDDKKTIDVGDGNKVTLDDDLPDSFPDSFPVYDGAHLEGAVQGNQDGIEGTVATWTTGDSFDDVTAFYKDAFDGGDWKLTTEGTVSGTAYWAVENSDASKAGYVSVSDGDNVSIMAVVGDNPENASSNGSSDDGSDSGSDSSSDDGSDGSDDGSDNGEDGSDGSVSLPDAVDLPNGFPSDQVPMPDDGRVSYANTITSNGVTSFMVNAYSKKSIEDLGNFYKDELEGNGFTQSVQTSDGQGVYAAYSENPDGTGTVVVLTITEADIQGYQQVYVQVTEA